MIEFGNLINKTFKTTFDSTLWYSYPTTQVITDYLASFTINSTQKTNTLQGKKTDSTNTNSKWQILTTLVAFQKKSEDNRRLIIQNSLQKHMREYN